jgi:hypothetical protein
MSASALRPKSISLPMLLLFSASLADAALAAPATTAIEHSSSIRTLDTPRDFPNITTRSEWETRARNIREQILVSCGLWPLPKRAPVRPTVFAKIEREGYSIEKVYFETLPGFYLAGNLYRPLGRGKGPFPGILNPHGHWKDGRMADNTEGSIAARCISFARQGMIAFSYDMVGFNDTHFATAPTNKAFYDAHRSFGGYGTNRDDQLWNIGLMGLQTWNSICALDFLEALPDADRKRLGCTGESGGGTQTFILGAIDDRLAVQAPVVMVSHTMQGGCSCENAPGLRIEYSNMEIAAVPAPRPQIMVAASGDWTKDMMTVEGPAVEGIYRLFNAQDNLRYVRFDFGHNYNQTSREAVYEWFNKILQPQANPASCKEEPYKKEPNSALRVFADDKLPANAASADDLTAYLKKVQFERWQSLIPDGPAGLKKYVEAMLPAWRRTLQVEWPQRATHLQFGELKPGRGFSSATVQMVTPDGLTNQAQYYSPRDLAADKNPRLVVLALGDRLPTTASGAPEDLLTPLLRRGLAVMVLKPLKVNVPPDQHSIFFTAYNRTRCQEQVRQLVSFCSGASFGTPREGGDSSRTFRVILAGLGKGGLWSLLSAPAADAVIADCDALNAADDEQLLEPELFCPGIRNLGTFEGVAMLAAPHPLSLHNVGRQFPYENLRKVYKAAGAPDKFQVETTRLTPEALAVLAAQI